MNYRCLLAAAALVSCTNTWADPAHDRIAADRAVANARFAERERECNSRFIVSSCLDDARKEHRDALGRLRAEEIRLDSAARHAAAEARRKAIADKVRALAARAAEPSASSARGLRPQRPAPVAGTTRAPRAAPAPAAPWLGSEPARTPRASAADRAATERQSIEKFEARTRAAQAHREAVERRNAEQAAQGKMAKPLPVPRSASSAL